ncbi:MAG: Asp-tRNA(Asn)/Glu-tRNA(Gln) amidotransferase subunit GatC [Vicingaceae bacterium]
MPIDDKTFDRIAELARLSFSEEEKASISKDLDKILAFMDSLNRVDTEGVEPLIYMNQHEDDLRKDEVTYVVSQEDALKNAPNKDSDYFKVPKVIDKGE